MVGARSIVVVGVLLACLIPGASASLPSQPAPSHRLNIVFVLTDDQSVESVAKMPFVSAYPGWITFRRAFINTPMCCPSRATISTGLYSHHTRIENNGDRARFDDSSTIATWLHAAGYRTGLFGKYHLGLHGEPQTYVPPGWDEWVRFRAPEDDGAYYGYTLNENGRMVQYGSKPKDYSTDVLSRKALGFIKRANGEQPFFLYLSVFSPHSGYVPAVRYSGRFKKEPIVHTAGLNEADMSDKPAWWRKLAPRKVPDNDAARRKQYASLLAVDDAVRDIFYTLRAKGMLKNTVIFFMTDNGYSFGEHRWRGKGCAYDPCVRTPFLVAYPGEGARTVSALASNVDIAPTFADLARAKPATPVDGRSLVPLITGATPPNWPKEALLHFKEDPSLGSPPSFWALRTARYEYIETVPSGEKELYDLSRDPNEIQSVSGRPDYAATQESLRRRLATLRATPPHGTSPPATTITSGPATRSRKRTVRFVFHSSATDAVFQCRLYRAALWANCASPKRYRRVSRGRYVFQVRAIDAVGNVDSTPASRSFSIR